MVSLIWAPYFSVPKSSIFHTNFVTFPGSTLASISNFTLNSVTGLIGLYNLSRSYKFLSLPPNGLIPFSIINGNDLSDNTIDRLFTFWVTISSQYTFHLWHYLVITLPKSRIPIDVPTFSQLDTIDMSDNLLTWLIPINSFNFKYPLSLSNLTVPKSTKSLVIRFNR